MLRRRWHAVLIVAATVEVSVAASASDRASGKGPQTSSALKGSVEAGVIDGPGALDVDVPAVIVALDERPELKWKHWRLRTPIAFQHRQTWLEPIDETRGEAAAELRFRMHRMRLTAELGAVGVWRPDWPDPYQPRADSSLATTDRRSHFDRTAGVTLTALPARGHHLRLAYAFRLVDYIDDPHFEPIAAPTHLVPADHDEHVVAASYNARHEARRLGAALSVMERQYFFAFSRDAGTGLTHAGEGGEPPNPLQRVWRFDGDIHGRWALGTALELEAKYAHRVQRDAYAGYYTYHGPAPSLALTWAARPGFQLTLADDFEYRRYGLDSYRVGAGHPPLDYGAHLSSARNRARLEASARLHGPLSITTTVELTSRRTNFPDYRPGIFPARRAYSIDWDYDDRRVLVGLRWVVGSRGAATASRDDES